MFSFIIPNVQFHYTKCSSGSGTPFYISYILSISKVKNKRKERLIKSPFTGGIEPFPCFYPLEQEKRLYGAFTDKRKLFLKGDAGRDISNTKELLNHISGTDEQGLVRQKTKAGFLFPLLRERNRLSLFVPGVFLALIFQKGGIPYCSRPSRISSIAFSSVSFNSVLSK